MDFDSKKFKDVAYEYDYDELELNRSDGMSIFFDCTLISRITDDHDCFEIAQQLTRSKFNCGRCRREVCAWEHCPEREATWS